LDHEVNAQVGQFALELELPINPATEELLEELVILDELLLELLLEL
jgi:hypothetical protein